MCKKMMTVVLCLILVFAMAACDTADSAEKTRDTVPQQAAANTPEEVAKQFYLALAQQDIDTLADLTAPYSYEVIAQVLNLPIEEGVTGKAAAKAAYTLAFQNGGILEVEYTDIEVTTRLTPEADIPGNILQEIHDGYVQHEMMTQETFDSIEATAWVDVACTLVLEDGSEEHQDYGEVYLICIQVEGKWYVDFVMVMCLPVRSEPQQDVVQAP